MKKFLILISLIVSSVSYSSSFRDLTTDEIDSLNWILQCPNEIAKLTQQGEWIGSGHFFSDRSATKYSYRFFRQNGFTTSVHVATLHVSRIRIQNPPPDSRGFRVECSIENESQ